MENKNSTKEKILLYSIYGLFTIYIALLLRITLFKQASLYNLFAAIGASERCINIIPFVPIYKMISNNISTGRILEIVLGNIIIFIPLGLLLPVILKRKSSRDIFLGGFLLSASIETVQFIFGLGSTDINDLILNTLGTIIGYLLFKFIKEKSKSSLSFLTSMVILVTVSGIIAFSVLLVTNTDLFVLFPKKIIVENGELVQAFIETPSYLSGKLVKVENSMLTVEKSVQRASEQKKLLEFTITADSSIYVCYNKINYFFNSISGEHQRYEEIVYSDFISQKSKTYSIDNNNVIIWSSDGKTVNKLVVIEWVE